VFGHRELRRAGWESGARRPGPSRRERLPAAAAAKPSAPAEKKPEKKKYRFTVKRESSNCDR